MVMGDHNLLLPLLSLLACRDVTEKFSHLPGILEWTRHRGTPDHIKVEEAETVDQGVVLLPIRLLHCTIQLGLAALIGTMLQF